MTPKPTALEGDHFNSALEDSTDAQERYADQLGMLYGRVPFAAESIPDASIQVEANEEVKRQIAFALLNSAGHVSISDKKGAGKTTMRDEIYAALSDRDDYDVLRLTETSSLTMRQLFTQVLDEVSRNVSGISVPTGSYALSPDGYPHATDAVRDVLREVAAELEDEKRTVVLEVDQLEDLATTNRSRARSVFAGLQFIADLGSTHPVFLLFLFGTPEASQAMNELRTTLDSRMYVKDRTLQRFEFRETYDLITRWLAWSRNEQWSDDYPSDPYSPGAIDAIVNSCPDGTPREIRKACFAAFQAGARQYEETDSVRITEETLREYAPDRFDNDE